jgi:hypothetical protein
MYLEARSPVPAPWLQARLKFVLTDQDKILSSSDDEDDIEELEKEAIKADFEEAVHNCDNGWRTRKIKSWLDAMEKGEHWDLRKSFLE